jgi:hypothetical protein
MSTPEEKDLGIERTQGFGLPPGTYVLPPRTIDLTKTSLHEALGIEPEPDKGKPSPRPQDTPVPPPPPPPPPPSPPNFDPDRP